MLDMWLIRIRIRERRGGCDAESGDVNYLGFRLVACATEYKHKYSSTEAAILAHHVTSSSEA